MHKLTVIILLWLCPAILQAQHPVTFFTAKEAAEVKRNISRYPLLEKSFGDMQRSVAPWLGKVPDVPMPKDPAGGYTHEQHKSNYTLIFQSGILYQLTGNKAYAELARQLLLKYAAMNPGLKAHPEARKSSPGHLFHQALNDANWLVYAGMGYDCIYNTLSEQERTLIAHGAFAPEVALFLDKDTKDGVDLIHNHGVWACAGVGIAGLATGNQEYVKQALYGLQQNGTGGFLLQLQQLFAPDGYYTEGPYYTRYALLPFFLLANAVENAQPQLKIFEQRNQVLRKALLACLQQTNTNGELFPLNDALRGMDYTTNDLLFALDIAWKAYGPDSALLAVAQRQHKVLLTGGGAAIAARLAETGKKELLFPYQSVSYTDGADGKEGGISLLRTGKGDDLTTLLYKYTAHGLSHGHFDKLTFSLYHQGEEIFRDYGSVRFVNVAPKFGGRYLPENDNYAMQTIAHSTLVADEKSHFGGKEKTAAQYHPDLLFSDIGQTTTQVVSVKDEHAYPGITMQRTMYLLQPAGFNKPVVVDLFRTTAAQAHQYDLPFQYYGQLITTSFPYKPFTTSQQPMGTANGYQYLWKEAEARPGAGIAQITFLNNRTYYTLSTVADSSTQIFFTRTGANDPDFNVRREPAFMLRKKGGNDLFASVIEVHGVFDPVTEISTAAGAGVKEVKVVYNGDDYTVINIRWKDGRSWRIAQCNKDFGKDTQHSVKGLPAWKGPYHVFYEQQ